MRHLAARVSTALALVAASLAWASPASAAEGFAVDIGQSPATFTIGKSASTLTAIASTERQQRRCIKVRWSLTVRTDGVSLDQIRVNRVEDNQTFRTRAEVRDDGAHITDLQLDPGQLCRDQTVTGRWDISFTGPDNGEVTFEAHALDVAGRELATASLNSRVLSPVAAKPSPSKSASPSPSATDSDETDEPVADPTTPADRTTSAAALNPASGTPSVLGPGLIIGAVLVFLGVALLLRIRTRNRKSDPAWAAETQTLPTGFYSMPKRRH